MFQFHNMSACRGDCFLAFENLQLDLISLAVPLHRVISGRQLRACDSSRFEQFHRSLACRKSASREQNYCCQKNTLHEAIVCSVHSSSSCFPTARERSVAAACACEKACVSFRKAYNSAPGSRDKFAHRAYRSLGGIVLTWPPNRE